MTSHRPAPQPLPPFARPDGSCLGRIPENEDDEESVPAAPAEPKDASVQPAEPRAPQAGRAILGS